MKPPMPPDDGSLMTRFDGFLLPERSDASAEQYC